MPKYYWTVCLNLRYHFFSVNGNSKFSTEIMYYKYSTEIMVFAFQVAEPGSIPGITYVSLSIRVRTSPWALLCCSVCHNSRFLKETKINRGIFKLPFKKWVWIVLILSSIDSIRQGCNEENAGKEEWEYASARKLKSTNGSFFNL